MEGWFVCLFDGLWAGNFGMYMYVGGMCVVGSFIHHRSIDGPSRCRGYCGKLCELVCWDEIGYVEFKTFGFWILGMVEPGNL